MKKAITYGIATPAFLVLLMFMFAGSALADTSVQVDWNSPNPDIHLSTSVGTWSDAWADVVGSGGIAAGEIRVIGDSAGWGTATAWQTAAFEGGEYTARVEAYGHESKGEGMGDWRTSQFFKAIGTEGTDPALIDGAWVEQEANDIRSPNRVDGHQSYRATGADLVVAGGSVYHYQCCGNPTQRVSYIGEAHGDIAGTQASHTEAWPMKTGFGAGIAGTEGTTSFAFDIVNVSHTSVIASGFSVWGESHTWDWTEPDLWADGFDWIG